MNAEFNWWLLILGLAAGAGIAWLVLTDLARRDEDLAERERATRVGPPARPLAADGRPWLMGERFTIADCCLVPTIDRMADLGLGRMWDGRPNVTAWYARVQARPCFAKTYYPMTRLSEIFAAQKVS